MRRFLVVFMLFIVLILTGCPGGEEEKKEEKSDKKTESKIDKNVAKEFMDNYFRYMMAGSTKAMNTFYSEEIKGKSNNSTAIINPGPVGFKLEEGNSKQGNMEYTAHIYSSGTKEPYFSDDTFKYTIENKGGKLLISKITKDNTIELFLKEKTIYKREGEKVMGEPIIKLSEMPLFTNLKGASEVKHSVPREGFGPCAIAPDGKSYVISSYGSNNSFIASVTLEDSKETLKVQSVAEEKGKDEKGGSNKEGEGQEGKEGEKGKEEAGNASVKAIDFYPSSTINLISFSPNGKSLLVLSSNKEGQSWVAIYSGKEWEPVKTYMDKHFPKSSFSITKAYFVEDNKLIFVLKPGEKATPEEQSMEGEWSYSIKEDKVTQIK